MREPAIRLTDAFALLILTIASIIGINQYTYGVYNHCITIPFVKSVIDPAMYPQDYLIAEKQFFYTYFLPFCGFLVQTFKLSLPVTFFILYALSLYATLMAVFMTALELFKKRQVAYLSVMMVIFSFTTLGMERTVENLLMERTLVFPLLLFSFYAFFIRWYNLSALLAGIAFLFHPLSACYVLAILILCFIYRLLKDKGILQFAAGIAVILLVISPIFILKITNPAPHLNLIRADPEWLALLRLRSAHHIFPSSWNKLEIFEGIAFIIGFVITWSYRPRSEYHRIVVIAFCTVMLMFVAGTIFTEIVPVSIVIQFQLFRSYKFIAFFAIIYFANFIFTAPNTRQGVALKVLVSALILAPYLHESPTVIAGIALVVFSTLLARMLLEKYKPGFNPLLIPAQIVMLLLLGIAGSMHNVNFSIYNAQDKAQLAVQDWARTTTSTDAAFIVPPQLEGFRVESERTVYGEWKDGTQMFFNPEFGHEWMRRMEKLGYMKDVKLDVSYHNLSQTDFQNIATEMESGHPKVFAVIPADMNLNFPVAFSNEKYHVVEVSANAPSHVAQSDSVKLQATSYK